MARKGYRKPESSAAGLLKKFEDNYEDGLIRALAQEPVQNAKDARLQDALVHVEYRLMSRMADDGKHHYMLTVKDSGTTGLTGDPNPDRDVVHRSTEQQKRGLRWYHFERLHDSNKGKFDGGSRGWGKLVFLCAAGIGDTQAGQIMIYDTLLSDNEYRLSDISILDDELEIREKLLRNSEAREAVAGINYVTPDGRLSVPLGLEPLSEVGTRVIVPFLSDSAVEAVRDGSLARWLEYLWWRPISDEHLSISVIDESRHNCQEIGEPKWWEGGIWHSDATEPGPPRSLADGTKVQILVNQDLEHGCGVKCLALQYDPQLSNELVHKDGPDYVGIQMMRAGQCIETNWDFDLIPPKSKQSFRGFVEFNEATEAKLKKSERPAHDGFRKSGVNKSSIRPFLKEAMHRFAEAIGVIERHEAEDSEPSESDRRTLEFVFDALASGAFDDAPNDRDGTNDADGTGNPWDVAVQLKYPSPATTRVNWGEKIENIRLVVKSQPTRVKHNTRLALEWCGLGEKYSALSKYKPRKGVEYALKNQLLTRDWVDEPHIICPKPGLYRIRAAVYEGKNLVKQHPQRVYVQTDPPERREHPYVVRISVDNKSNPREKRISDGDTLRLKIYGRNRMQHDVSGKLFLRMKEGTILKQPVRFAMEGTPLGGDDSPQLLDELTLKTIKGDSTSATTLRGLTTLQLETGEHTIQAYLLRGDNQLAYGSHELHFESDPAQTSGGYPFELQPIVVGTPAMWELDMAMKVLKFAAKHPLNEASHNATISANGELHGAYMLEVCISGLLHWALEPLMDEDQDLSNIETLRESKHNFSDEDAWDKYMQRLTELETLTLSVSAGEAVSPLEYDLRWRLTVAAVHEVLNAEEST